MITKSFEDTIIDGVNELRGQQADLIRNLDQLDKSVKSAFEEMTRLKNLGASQAEMLASLKRALNALEQERRSVYRSREEAVLNAILGNEDRRNFYNAWLRKKCDRFVQLPEHLERALTTESGLGGATVPTIVAEEIYSLLSTYGVWSGFDVMRVPSSTTTVPVATGRPTPYWIGAGAGAAQGTAITASDPAGASVTVSIQTLGALVHVNRELIDDSAVDISGYVLRELAQALAYGLDYVCLSAGGSANQTDGGYTGIFNAASLNTNLAATAAATRTTVGATTIDDWIRCLTTVSPEVLRRGAKWFMHPAILAAAMGVKDTAGRPLFMSAMEAPAFGGIGSILGYPVVLADAAPSTNAASAKVAVFGDPNGLAVALRQDMELAQTDALKFAENQVSLRGTVRAGVRIKTTSDSTALRPLSVLTLPAS